MALYSLVCEKTTFTFKNNFSEIKILVSLCSEIHKLINSIWNNEELHEEWKELIIVPIYKKGDKTDCRNYRGILLLSTTYRILTNILLSR